MQKNALKTAFAAAISLAVLEGCSEKKSNPMEKCTVVDAQGRGLIKANKADCKSATSSCAGQNKAGDPQAWILVPKGQCAKINAGKLEGIAPEILEKIELPAQPK